MIASGRIMLNIKPTMTKYENIVGMLLLPTNMPAPIKPKIKPQVKLPKIDVYGLKA